MRVTILVDVKFILFLRLYQKNYQIQYALIKILIRMQHHILRKLFNFMKTLQNKWLARVTSWTFLLLLLIRFVLTFIF